MTNFLRAQRLDLARATHAIACRMRTGIEAWQSAHAGIASPSAISLADLAIASGAAVESKAEGLIERLKAGDDVPRESIATLSKRLGWLNSIAATVQQSTHASLHPVISPTVHSLIKSLGVEGQVLVSGADSLAPYELNTLRQSVFEELVDPATLSRIKDWPFLVFSIPRSPLDWPLHYALIFHEIGHAVFASRHIADELEIHLPTHLQTAMSDLTGKSTDEIGDVMRVSRLAADFTRVAASWVEELFADAFGMLAAGPIYASSFGRVVALDSRLDSATSTHPPAAFRLHFMSEIANERDEPTPPRARREYLRGLPSNLADALRGLFDEAEHVHTRGNYHPRPGSEEIRDLVLALCNEASRLHPQVLQKAEAVLRGRVHDASAQAADVHRAELLSTHSIPIIEADRVPSLTGPGKPLEAARIFAGHWIAYYLEANKGSGANATEHYQLMAEYGDRLLGSLDAMEALRAWVDAG